MFCLKLILLIFSLISTCTWSLVIREISNQILHINQNEYVSNSSGCYIFYYDGTFDHIKPDNRLYVSSLSPSCWMSEEKNCVQLSYYELYSISHNIRTKNIYTTRRNGEVIVDRIYEILESNGISRLAWFQTFTGNHLRKLLSSIEILNAIFHAVPKDVQLSITAQMNILSHLGVVQEFTAARFLMANEIEELQAELELLEEAMFIPSTPHITPKAQLLLRHVFPFVSQHKFWGKASEQSIEHLHAVINKDLRRFCAIKEKKKLYEQISELQNIRNYLIDQSLNDDF